MSSFIPINDRASLNAMSAMPISLMEMFASNGIHALLQRISRVYMYGVSEKDRNEEGERKMKKNGRKTKIPYTVIRAENRPNDRPVTVGAVSDALAE